MDYVVHIWNLVPLRNFSLFIKTPDIKEMLFLDENQGDWMDQWPSVNYGQGTNSCPLPVFVITLWQEWFFLHFLMAEKIKSRITFWNIWNYMKFKFLCFITHLSINIVLLKCSHNMNFYTVHSCFCTIATVAELSNASYTMWTQLRQAGTSQIPNFLCWIYDIIQNLSSCLSRHKKIVKLLEKVLPYSSYSIGSEDKYLVLHASLLCLKKKYLLVSTHYFSHFSYLLPLDGTLFRFHRANLSISHVVVAVPSITYSFIPSQSEKESYSQLGLVIKWTSFSLN